jgi:hypothetical protein
MLSRRTASAWFTLAIIAASTTNCSSAPSTLESATESLDGPGKAMCSLIRDLGNVSIGPIGIDDTDCQSTDYDNLYYLGSVSRSIRFQGGHAAEVVSPNQRPDALSKALYCAIGYSDGLHADGTVSALGGMGVRSRIHMTKKDAAAREVSGQRVGTLVVFGAAMDIEDQDFDVTFPTESGRRPSSGPVLLESRSVGYYMDLKTSAVSWHVGGGGQLGPFALKLRFGQNGSFDSVNNNGVVFRPANQANAPSNHYPFNFDYARVHADCNACQAACQPGRFCVCPSNCSGSVGFTCACPSTEQVQFEACTNCSRDFGNLADGQLPYYGDTGGAAGPYFYSDTSYDWFHFGTPGTALVGGEPFASAPDKAPTTSFSASLGYSLEILTLEIAADLSFRDAFAVTQGSEFSNEFRDHYGNVATLLDAQSEASVSAHVIIDFPLPFVDHPIADFRFDILKPSSTDLARGTAKGPYVAYDYTQGNPIKAFDVGGRAASIDACLAVPPQTSPPVPTGNPADFANAVSQAAIGQLHPCHVDICPNGVHQKCEWNAATKKLDCAAAAGPCTACTSSAAMCDAQGNVYQPSSTQRTQTCDPR